MMKTTWFWFVVLLASVVQGVVDPFVDTMEFVLKNSDPEYVRMVHYVIQKQLTHRCRAVSQEMITRGGKVIVRVFGLNSILTGNYGHVESWKKVALRRLVKSFSTSLEEMVLVEAEWRGVSDVSPI